LARIVLSSLGFGGRARHAQSTFMNQPGALREIEIRHCTTLAEYEECVRLEHAVWGDSMVVPSAMFVVAHHTGGHVIGAFDADSRGPSGSPKMVGFCLGFVGSRPARPSEVSAKAAHRVFIHSHMAAVLPDYRDRGVGRRLKLFQRRDALKRGIDLIEWTFDPLELKNAHFNLVRLGAIARRIHHDFYGVTESPLHAGLPTDRLIAEWWLDSERVRSILADNPLPSRGPVQHVPFPANLAEIKKDRAAAASIQATAREQFQRCFAKGYVVTGVETRGGSTNYMLEPGSSVAGLQLPLLIEDPRHA
jgi:predicted GNAT superfamily acetyltransferase